MDSFYIIVSAVAIILLISVLTYVGIKMSDKTSNVLVYPPSSQPCPDYWVQSSDSKNPGCVIGKINSGNTSGNYNISDTLGYKVNGNVINFADNAWTSGGKTAICQQQKWANKYDVHWDGVSNYNSC